MIEKEQPAHRFGEPQMKVWAFCVYLSIPAGSQIHGCEYAFDGVSFAFTEPPSLGHLA